MAASSRDALREPLVTPGGLCLRCAEPAEGSVPSAAGWARKRWLRLQRCDQARLSATVLAATTAALCFLALSSTLAGGGGPAASTSTAEVPAREAGGVGAAGSAVAGASSALQLGAQQSVQWDEQCQTTMFSDDQSCWSVAWSASESAKIEQVGLWGLWITWLRTFLLCKGEQQCHQVARRVKQERNESLSDKTCCEIVTLLVDDRWIIYVVLSIVLVLVIFLMWLCHTAGAYRKPKRPPYWVHPERAWTRCAGLPGRFDDNFYKEVDVTEDLRDQVQALFDIRTDVRRMGVGRDGGWVRDDAGVLQYDKFQVVNVTRIENGRLWSAYARSRDSIHVERSKVLDHKRLTRAFNAMWSESEKGRGSSLADEFWSTLGLDESKNEVILFHGCPGIGARNPMIRKGEPMYDTQLWTEPPSPVDAVCKQGFDDRVGKLDGMLGAGTYFADMVSKADCYAGKYLPMSESEVNAEATIFITRVVLGTPYLADQALEGLRRPPCFKGHFDTNLKGLSLDKDYCTPWAEKGVEFMLCDHERFHSVITDRQMKPKGKLWNEYVIYGKQAYPEFRVKYKRVKSTT